MAKIILKTFRPSLDVKMFKKLIFFKFNNNYLLNGLGKDFIGLKCCTQFKTLIL